ncbi:protein brambleberry-like isoform X2 [Amblyraja radiata]|uniref:protein brambleberry-like isoform X2 n=1 Tax=Amblyraja radiata TaxID=386614 RepID=UPI001401F514|nr:protein brambleberry-like isoform X2 [Amblyraja radiata]
MDLRRSLLLLLLGLTCHLAAASGSFFLHPQPPLPLFERSETEEPPPALPELDGCQRAVLGELTLSCSDLSEEHLSKLGMALFNCRAAAEHRPTYPCTPGMALSDCTQGMDAATRKAYHMVRNHARALCHADRQQHLRPRAETTANCSAHAPSCLLEVMNILKDGQAELRELTAASLEKLVNSQKLLLQQQEQLEAWRQDVESSINANLEKLAQGRAVPTGGHQLIAELIEGITLTVDNVSEQLVHQDLQLHQGQQTILAHLLEVGARLHQLDTKLEWKLALFAAHQSQTAVHHEQLEKLQKMNDTVGTVRHVLGHLEQGESLRMNTLQHFLNWTGRDLHVMYTCVVHTSCFLAAAVIMTFLQTPGFSRAVLLVLVLLNALSQLNHCASLDLTSLSAFLTLTVVGNWMLINCFGCRMRTSVWTPVLLRSQRPGFFTSTPERKCAYSEWVEEREKMDHDSLQGKGSPHGTAGNYALENACFIRGSPLTPAPVETVQPTTNPVAYSFKVPAPLMALLPLKNPPPLPNCAQWEAAEKNSAGEIHRLQHHTSVFEAETFLLHDSAGSTSSLSRRLPCCGITRTGQQCRNKAASGREFCRVHGSEQTLACR